MQVISLISALLSAAAILAKPVADNDQIFVPAYWPVFNDARLVRFDYTSADGSMPPFTSVFSFDQGSSSMLYNNYDSKLTWLNRWYYQYRPGFGVAEWRDDYPKQKVVMNPPIGWGEYATLGGKYQNNPQFDFLKCDPPASGTGLQIVTFEALLPSMTVHNVPYSNVLQFSYSQSWNGKTPNGARYWMALGIGPIAVEFIINGTTTSRADAVISRVGKLF